MKETVEMYDTTLRDGSQGEGVNYSLEDKLRLTEALDDFGVHYIEGGWPGSNPKDEEYFAAVMEKRRKNAAISAFGSTRRVGNTAAADPNLRKIVKAKPDIACIFGKAWDLHVRDALRVSQDENLAMIASSIAFLRKRVGRAMFDAEHFFDGYAANPEYALKALDAALGAGAEAIILCDTNGGRLTVEIADGVKAVRARFPGTRVGIHCHNDSGLAVANSVEAVRQGARLVQGCLNGFGERTGNADMCSIIPIVELKLGLNTVGAVNMARLTNLSRFAYELANMPHRPHQPFVGTSAFAHKGGIHVSAMVRNPLTYESFQPEKVGNSRRILISELAGKASILARRPDLASHPDKMGRILAEVGRRENEGYAYENADASFELLIRRVMGNYEPAFDLLGFRASSEERKGEDCLSEASVKLRIGDIGLHTVAEELHGPVAALDRALRKALVHAYSFVEEVRLTDYRVHIVNAQAATEARVRVVIQSREEGHAWGTVGVSENILHASCQALVDSFQYLILRHGGGKAARFGKRLHNLAACRG